MNSHALEQILRRKSIPRGQLTLLKYLSDRDEWVPSSELVDQIRWGSDDEFRGVVGAFGKRINATSEITGEPGSSAFVERTQIDGETQYRLRSEARKAIGDVDVLLDTFDQHSLAELLEPGTEIEAERLVGES
ncbi:hypothetical protein C489_00090 [Natrinema versiforme JCM 10478]|uniref:Uncharacterized protein n=1 Tax=Natrinema versiforme JCM 10478 TaxID=1227496 RepID=L9YBV6_9EURY|nr:hypothetical protein C489_00090 [Natrinema versiforme JCM 10478]